MSGAELVQQTASSAFVVKAFSVYGFENFEDTGYPGYRAGDVDLKSAMFIAGDDAEAKRVVSALCVQLGWEVVDTGPLSMSLHLEHMALLWIKMAGQARKTGFVWARLLR